LRNGTASTGVRRPDRTDYTDVACCLRPTAARRPSIALLPWLFLSLLLTALVAPAQAAPDWDGPLLYGLDPMIRTSEDPRLLGSRRLVLRERLLGLGIDPVRDQGARPTIATSIRHYWNEKSRVDLKRVEELVEYNGTTGLMTVIQYPTFFYLFPSQQTLPGGFVYYPPRPVDDPVVRLFVDDLEEGTRRRHEVARTILRTESLDIVGKGRRADDDGGLLNLTIPIKLPRTLEKIIGRGEKTRIKITGREHISLSGESSVTKPFTATERISSQSLFPTLDMQQELQVNLSGTIGEKIIIEVDHNSAAIGPDATKIKLMYQGLEDEIIKTIETGDVGLTLPGSQLLGYSSSKSGLFGIKVTGQVGRADFTVLTSKQKAESSSKTFNSKGGQVEDNVILSYQYLNNRFFRLDLPEIDQPGRNPATHGLDLASIHVYKMMGPGEPTSDDITNVAAYIDESGIWQGIDFENDHYIYGQRWREMNFVQLTDDNDILIGVDLRQQMLPDDILAVVYDVVDAAGTRTRVGDLPGPGGGSQEIPGELGGFYRMKLLKAKENSFEDYPYQYVLRNIYSLGGSGIDPETFDLRIEYNQPGQTHPDQDVMNDNVPYIRLFGLDQGDAQGGTEPDGVVDKHNARIFDLANGLLRFPVDFHQPFNAGEDVHRALSRLGEGYVWEGTDLADNQAPNLYDPSILSSQHSEYGFFKIISSHASAASSFNLGVSNIEEGSERVTLDGRTLTNGVDYEIDYTFGQITLKGEAANLSATSQIAVDYQYAPFFGGGQSSLTGLNVGYDLGRESKLSTTWLYQTESIVGEKAKLGEEPSKNLVGNINLQHTFKPYFLTHVANFLARHNTERESSLQFSGEMAMSLPNPNTKGQVYLEDFEGVDSSDLISLTRTGWFWASAPDTGLGIYTPENRVESVRWYLPKDRSLRRHLNPDLVNQERDETQPSMDMYLRADDGDWGTEDWGGIMRGISRTGLDLSKSQFLEFWVNDGEPDRDLRSGKLHVDFGYISEDGFWPVVPSADGQRDSLVVGKYEQEDGIVSGTPDFIFKATEEDVGLDGNENGPQRYSAEHEINGDSPFPRINGTARNNREDSEDLNGSTIFDMDNGFFTVEIDLKETEALVDVVYDYDNVDDLVEERISWRKYRVRITDVSRFSEQTVPNIRAVTHIRLWYENDDPQAPESVVLQLSELKFLGSRWEREGVRRAGDESLIPHEDRMPGEEFFLGEVNNKENPDYYSPFSVREVGNIPEKEQSLVLDFNNLEPGHMVRASKQVSPQGDDYTGYREMSWYWYNPTHEQADLDLFFRVGSDTLNYYQIDYRFADSEFKTEWHNMNVGIAELSNVKNGELDPNTGHVLGTVHDARSGQEYPVRVVGRPDLRKIRRYYMGVANHALSREISGYIWLNDIKLEGVKTDRGVAQRAGFRLNMADVIKMDFDWSHRDAEYRGLDKRTGSGIDNNDWNFATNFNLDDFIPLAGFRLPLNASRRQTIQRPKYETNSDIEIIDEDVRNEMSSIDTQERFSSRLSHTPSKAAVPRYVIDPWTLLVSGSRSSKTGPTEERQTKNLQGSVTYDLRIQGKYHLGDYPVLEHVPIVKGLSIVPSKIAFGGSFTSNYSASATIADDGTVSPRPTTITRPARLNASLDYQPISILNLTASGNSERDMLRERKLMGVNIGAENQRSYELRMTITPPSPKGMPKSKVMYPVRQLARGLEKMRPSVQFTGTFQDDHRPSVRREDDPPGTRNVSNGGNWEFRFSVPVGDAFKALIPEKKYSESERQRLIEQEKSAQAQNRNRNPGGVPPDQQTMGPDDDVGGGPGGPPVSSRPPDTSGMTPEEAQEAMDEWLLQQAEEREALEAEQGLRRSTPVEAEDEAAGEGEKKKFKIPNPLTPIFDMLRNTTPVKATFTDRKDSGYSRLTDTAGFWYSTGLQPKLDVDDSLYVARSYSTRKSVNLSTTSKVGRNVSLDVKYGYSTAERENSNSTTSDYQQDWPDAQISLSGLERWKIFGGGESPDGGWFRASTFNFSYKRSKTVTGMTEISHNPRTNLTINPRWTITLHSGMSVTATYTWADDESISNGVVSTNKKSRIGLQLRHQFQAQSFLAKIGLYRPGSNPAVNMDVEVSYDNNRAERLNPGGTPSTPTGQTRINVNPRFSYQVTRNLSGALRFIFSRAKNLATDQTTTTLGLGVEATFVF